MRFVLAASVLVPLFTADAASGRMERWLEGHPAGFLVSDFASAEVSSAIARKVRERLLTREEAALAFQAFDRWTSTATGRVAVAPEDIAAAQEAIRLLGPPLRTPDAIHVAIARRLDATLVTFDRQLASTAAALGLQVAPA